MGREMDAQVLSTTISSVVKDTFEKVCHADFTAQPVVTERDIIEYNSRMRVFPMEKFNGPCYIGVVNYHVSQRDLDAGIAIGTVVLFVKADVMDKMFRALGRSVRETEDEGAVFDVLGEFSSMVAGNIKNEFSSRGYAELFLSAPLKYRNSVPEGVPFDYSLFRKQEIAFSFWNQKCIVIEACIGKIPQRAK